MKIKKYRRCRICKKKVFKDRNVVCIIIVDKKDKRGGWYHFTCNNNSIWAQPIKFYRRKGMNI
ncbi:MAG: hypothetical protein AABY22_36985 [Nanoarchaeota archaeon]